METRVDGRPDDSMSMAVSVEVGLVVSMRASSSSIVVELVVVVVVVVDLAVEETFGVGVASIARER